MTQKHTPEPWATDYRERPDGMFAQEVFDANGETIATLAWFPVDSGVGTTTNREANARRIVACVNACKGWETSQLEAMEMGGLKESLMRVMEQRDELLAALVNAKESLECCYDVTDWPCNGSTDQDKAIAMASAAITKITGETK